MKTLHGRCSSQKGKDPRGKDPRGQGSVDHLRINHGTAVPTSRPFGLIPITPEPQALLTTARDHLPTACGHRAQLSLAHALAQSRRMQKCVGLVDQLGQIGFVRAIHSANSLLHPDSYKILFRFREGYEDDARAFVRYSVWFKSCQPTNLAHAPGRSLSSRIPRFAGRKGRVSRACL